MPVCKGCGGSYDDSFKFCPYCGRAKPKRETIKVKVEVTSEDVWETCEIHLVYNLVKAPRLGGALGLKYREYIFESTAIGPQGRYAAAWSESLKMGHISKWNGAKVGDWHYDLESPSPSEPILHRNNVQPKLDELIKKLVSDNWQPFGRGEHWYSERFRRLVKKKKTSSKG